jgi:hypothetical protein
MCVLANAVKAGIVSISAVRRAARPATSTERQRAID